MKSFNGSHPSVVSPAFFVVRPPLAAHVLAILVIAKAPLPSAGRATPIIAF